LSSLVSRLEVLRAVTNTGLILARDQTPSAPIRVASLISVLCAELIDGWLMASGGCGGPARAGGTHMPQGWVSLTTPIPDGHFSPLPFHQEEGVHDFPQ